MLSWPAIAARSGICSGGDLLLAEKVVDHQDAEVLVARAQRDVNDRLPVFFHLLVHGTAQDQIHHRVGAAL